MFILLEKLDGHVRSVDDDLFYDDTCEAVREGNFAISHIQWAAYLRAEAPGFLRMLVAMFAPPIATSDGIMTVAEQLGFEFNYQTDDRSRRVKSLIIEKRRGKNPYWSLVAYDKRKSLAHMRQGKSLTPAEGELVDSHVRLDLTAHRPAILEIIGDARNWIKKNPTVAAAMSHQARVPEFLTAEPQATARWLEVAIYILSHRVIRKKVMRGSFASYLLPHVINQVFRFDAALSFTIADLHAFEQLEDPIAKAWRSIDNFKGTDWVRVLSKLSGYGKSVLYERRKGWRNNITSTFRCREGSIATFVFTDLLHCSPRRPETLG